MKKKVLCLLLAALMLCAMLPQQANAASASDLTFTLNSDGESYSVSECKKSAQGTLQIPATYQGKPITGIDSEAFFGCSGLTNITIPDSVTSIGDYAFGLCRNLTDITIPDSVTSIGQNAFWDCRSLTDITIPDSITVIKSFTFNSCSSLTNVTIPDSVTGIGWRAFVDCSSLTNVIIPDSVTYISLEAFLNCSSLTDITIPDSVTSIGGGAFSGCHSLTEITIPASVTYISDGPFADCGSLTGIWVDENNPSYSNDNLGVLFDKDKVTLIQVPSGLIGKYAVPDSVTRIGGGAFSGCRSLTEITIPDSVTSIDNFAFADCTSLTDVYYGGSEQQWAQIRNGSETEPPTTATIHFGARSVSDVELTSWQYTHVKYALERNLMAGKGMDARGWIQFDPNSPITREEFVQVLYNAEDKPAVDLLNPFPDVVDTGWYKNAVLWAKENNIANGGGDGNFGVGARIIRQDLALMLYKYAVLKGCSLETDEGVTDQYGDSEKIAGYAKTAMDWAVTNGILSGKGTAGQSLSSFRLDPTGTATRAECAAMLRNFMTAFGL